MNAEQPVIRLRGLSKQYGTHTALADVDLDIMRGAVVGLVGPNGAGKTTLLRLISGLSLPTSGEGEVAGCRIAPSVRPNPHVGLVTERPPFVDHLSGRTNLRLLAGIRRAVSREGVDQAMKEVGLDPASRKPVGSYSHGMRQRLALAQAIMERPPVLLLDEPTNGLDIDGSLLLRSVIERQAGEGTTVVLSSHSLVDVEAVCGRVLMVENGIVRELALPDGSSGDTRTVHVTLAEEPPAWVIANLGLRLVSGLRYEIDVSGQTHEVVRLLVEAGAKVEEVGAAPARLEDVYLSALRSAS